MTFRFALALPMLFLFACSGASSEEGATGGDNGEENGPLESQLESGVTGLSVDAGATLRTTANLNFRMGPSLQATIQRVLAKGTVVKAEEGGRGENGFLAVTANGLRGYMFMKYLALDAEAERETESDDTDVADINGEPSVKSAIARAKSAMGFSYHWGGGSWSPGGATRDNAGSCSGACPNCSHRGTYGADCSGLVAKAWQFGEKDVRTSSHPFGTADFAKSKPGYWSTLSSRGEASRGDAFVYRADGAGHVVLYERGDAWGQPVVYECKGCSYGCVYNARSLGSGYKGIRRDGFQAE